MRDINFSSSWPKRIRQQTEAIGKKSTAVHSDWEDGIKYLFDLSEFCYFEVANLIYQNFVTMKSRI